jgi:hypothetical protein
MKRQNGRLVQHGLLRIQLVDQYTAKEHAVQILPA